MSFRACGAATLTACLLLPGLASAERLGADGAGLDLSRFVTGLQNPTAAEFLPDGRLVILEYGGRVRVRPAAGGNLIDAGQLPTAVGRIEQGGLGLAVDPRFATTNRLYFYYSEPNTPENDRHRVAWTTLDPQTNQIDANVTVILRGLYGPANHNGGGIAFGPDGHLYVGTGDTGCNCNCRPGTANNYFPTCLTNLQGKILRIDRDGNVPADNPLVGVNSVRACGANPQPCGSGPNVQPSDQNTGGPRTEIWNWGFRNAWRFGFDEQTGHLWIGDVGEVTWEEITISTGPAQHHGWPFREGEAGDPVSSCSAATPQSGDCVEPAFAYSHNERPAAGMGSVTGGVFSNHCSWPAAWAGAYWFAGYSKGRIWTLTPNAARTGVDANSRRVVVEDSGGVVHMTRGPDGAIYAVDLDNGRIYRIAPSAPASCGDPDAGVVDGGGPPLPPDASADAGGADVPLFEDAESFDADPLVDAGLPPPDGGAAADASPGDTGSAAPDAGTGSAADAGALPMTDDEGCGCTTTGRPDTDDAGAGLGLLLLGLALGGRRAQRLFRRQS
jgi:glucose/arabinose dehydrogenase